MRRIWHNFSSALVLAAVFGAFALAAAAQSNSDLIGTYRLDTSRSENTKDIIESATQNTNTSDADKADLADKLEAPEIVAIDLVGNSVTLATSEASNPITFTADGTTKTTQKPDGTSIRVRAAIKNQTLTISSLGGETDYTLIFKSIDGGNNLQVTRRITTEYLSYTVFADSFYQKTDTIAEINGIRIGNSRNTAKKDSGTYSSSDSDDNPVYPNPTPAPRNAPSTRTTTRSGNFIVPNGTNLSGTLEKQISTKVSQNNDRFRLMIDSPRDYQGAVIEGYLSGIKRSGRVTGSSKLTLNFETIRMRNGETYDFAGFTQSITNLDGKTVKIGKEGEIQGNSQTKKSAKRGGIGAGIGAILGGIIGGGKGAIIGATIGGGAGAGSVIAEGKGDVELDEGSTIS
ncbi:MAG: hypothetical protein HKN25_13760, partial [Pyrinomonadaceae bacterium]|nr:hypothetical protein [Pyrinomonadaceae bacterium]